MAILHQYEPIKDQEKILPVSQNGVVQYSEGKDGKIFITGNILKTAIELSELIKKNLKKNFGIFVIKSIKPLPTSELKKIFEDSETFISIEENTLLGGLGSSLLEFLNDNLISKNLLDLARQTNLLALETLKNVLWKLKSTLVKYIL